MVWRRLKGNFQSEAEFIDALNKKPELDYDYLLEKAGSPRRSSRLYSMIEYELRHMRNGDEKWSQTGSTGSGSVFCPHGVGGVFQGRAGPIAMGAGGDFARRVGPAIQLEEEQAIALRKLDATAHLALQHGQLMPERGILRFKSAVRLERRSRQSS